MRNREIKARLQRKHDLWEEIKLGISLTIVAIFTFATIWIATNGGWQLVREIMEAIDRW